MCAVLASALKTNQRLVIIHLGGTVVPIFSDTLVRIIVPLFDGADTVSARRRRKREGEKIHE